MTHARVQSASTDISTSFQAMSLFSAPYSDSRPTTEFKPPRYQVIPWVNRGENTAENKEPSRAGKEPEEDSDEESDGALHRFFWYGDTRFLKPLAVEEMQFDAERGQFYYQEDGKTVHIEEHMVIYNEEVDN